VITPIIQHKFITKVQHEILLRWSRGLPCVLHALDVVGLRRVILDECSLVPHQFGDPERTCERPKTRKKLFFDLKKNKPRTISFCTVLKFLNGFELGFYENSFEYSFESSYCITVEHDSSQSFWPYGIFNLFIQFLIRTWN
jgi:hypothetical protein